MIRRNLVFFSSYILLLFALSKMGTTPEVLLVAFITTLIVLRSLIQIQRANLEKRIGN
jgi:hypothetical protein